MDLEQGRMVIPRTTGHCGLLSQHNGFLGRDLAIDLDGIHEAGEEKQEQEERAEEEAELPASQRVPKKKQSEAGTPYEKEG